VEKERKKRGKRRDKKCPEKKTKEKQEKIRKEEKEKCVLSLELGLRSGVKGENLKNNREKVQRIGECREEKLSPQPNIEK